MPQTQRGLTDAYAALFSDTPYGILLRRQVQSRLQSRLAGAPRTTRRTSGGPTPNAGTVTSDPYADVAFPDTRGGPGDPFGGSSRGGVPGRGTPGGRGPVGIDPEMSPSVWGGPATYGSRGSIDFGFDPSSKAASRGARAGFGFGLIGSGLGWGLGSLIGGSRYSPGVKPERFTPFSRGGFYGGNPAPIGPVDRAKFDPTFSYDPGGFGSLGPGIDSPGGMAGDTLGGGVGDPGRGDALGNY